MKSNLFLKTILAFAFSTSFSFMAHAELSESCQKLSKSEASLTQKIYSVLNGAIVSAVLSKNAAQLGTEYYNEHLIAIADSAAYRSCLSEVISDSTHFSDLLGDAKILFDAFNFGAATAVYSENNQIKFMYIDGTSVITNGKNNSTLLKFTKPFSNSQQPEVITEGTPHSSNYFWLYNENLKKYKSSKRVIEQHL